MADLAIRKATADDLDFAWTAYAENAKSGSSQQWDEGQEKPKFGGRWSAENTRVIMLDGEKIGWYSCLSRGSELLIENFQVLKGNRGIPAFVLNIIVMEAKERSERLASCSFKNDPAMTFTKVSLDLSKSDPAAGFFRAESFPITEESGVRLRVDVSGILEHAHEKWNKN